VKLEEISAEIRPRGNWEAVDLGWAMVRKHYGTILRAWMLTIWPLWALILVLLHNHLGWAMILIWWLKPIYDRIPLFVLSNTLFGPVPKMRDVFRAWPGLFFKNLFHALFMGRLSTHRSLVLPIAQLEGFRGTDFRKRAKPISSKAAGPAWWMQVASLLLLHGTWIGFAFFIHFMIPNPEGVSTWSMIMRIVNEGYLYPYSHYVWILLYLGALTLIEPFYVGGGFGMYLNTRTELEGWDVELSFRRMADRLREMSVAASVVLLLGLGLAMPTPAHAQEDAASPSGPPSSPEEGIETVLAHPDFEIQKRTIRIPNEDLQDAPSWGFPDLGFAAGGLQFFQFLFWAVAIAILAFLLIMILRYLLTLKGGGSTMGMVGPAPKAKTVMGMNVERESLPSDVVAAARKLWAEAKYQDAIGLLYRGAISWLINSANLAIEESDTEEECLMRARHLPQETLVSYFVRLTRAWITTAYGDQPPNDEEAGALFDQWPFRNQALKEVT